jgi:hypothetical protein
MQDVDSAVRRSRLDVIDYTRSQQAALLMCHGLAFVLLGIGSLFVPLTESLTFDEIAYFDSGVAVLSGRSSTVATLKPGMNIMPALALYPIVGNTIVAVMPSRVTAAVPDVVKARLPVYAAKGATIGMSLLLAVCVFVWARSLYGVAAGFLALTLYVLDPNIIGHSRVVHQNILEACTICVALYCFWRLLHSPSRSKAALAMLAFAVAQITRLTALYLIPIYAILVIGVFEPAVWRTLKDGATTQLLRYLKVAGIYVGLFGLSALILINIGFMADGTLTRFGSYTFTSRTFRGLQANSAMLRAVPVPLPVTYMIGVDFARYMQESSHYAPPPYLNGRLGIDNGVKHGFKTYYLIALLYKMPIATQLLIVLAAVGLLRSGSRHGFWRAEAFLIVPCLVFVAVFSLGNAQAGLRYILMTLPLLFVFASSVMTYWPRSHARDLVIVGLIGYLLVSNLSYFPHYLSYFNELITDRKLSYTVLADSNLDWGQNGRYLLRYLEEHPDAMFSSVDTYLRQLPPERLFDPQRPKPGLVVIAANELLGLMAPPERYRWIREKLEPIDHVAYSYLVFRIEEQDLPSVLSPSRQ